MTRKAFSFLICLMIVSLSGCVFRRATPSQPAEAPAQQAPAAQPAPAQALPGGVLFQDDFQDGSPDGWVISSGWTVNQDGDLYTFGTAVAGAAFVQGGGGWDNYLFSSRLKLDAGSTCLISRWTKAGRYLVQYQSDGLYLLKEAPAGTYLTLLQTSSPALGRWHNFSIGNAAGHIQVSVDQVVALDYTDPSPLLHGTVGVGAIEGVQASVDDVLVSRLQGALPAANPVGQQQPAPNQAPPAVAAPPLEDSGEILVEQLPAQPEEPESQEEPESGGEISAGQPDLMIRQLEPSSTVRIPGENLQVSIVVGNAGNGDAGAFTVVWFPDSHSNTIGCSWDVNRLAARQTQDLSCEYPGYPQVGTFTSSAYIDWEQEITESNETNNAYSSEKILVKAVSGGENEGPSENQQGGLPDLALTDMSHTGDVPLGEPVTFRITVVNQGTAPAGAFTVVFFPNELSNVVACSYDINGLAVNETQRLTCEYTYPTSGYFAFRIVVDSENEIAESNENDNFLMSATNIIE